MCIVYIQSLIYDYRTLCLFIWFILYLFVIWFSFTRVYRRMTIKASLMFYRMLDLPGSRVFTMIHLNSSELNFSLCEKQKQNAFQLTLIYSNQVSHLRICRGSEINLHTFTVIMKSILQTDWTNFPFATFPHLPEKNLYI